MSAWIVAFVSTCVAAGACDEEGRDVPSHVILYVGMNDRAKVAAFEQKFANESANSTEISLWNATSEKFSEFAAAPNVKSVPRNDNPAPGTMLEKANNIVWNNQVLPTVLLILDLSILTDALDVSTLSIPKNVKKLAAPSEIIVLYTGGTAEIQEEVTKKIQWPKNVVFAAIPGLDVSNLEEHATSLVQLTCPHPCNFPSCLSSSDKIVIGSICGIVVCCFGFGGCVVWCCMKKKTGDAVEK